MLAGVGPVLSLAQAGELDLAAASDLVTDYLSAFNDDRRGHRAHGGRAGIRPGQRQHDRWTGWGRRSRTARRTATPPAWTWRQPRRPSP
ncbi:MAG: hypothetical protein ACLTDR_11745 [Adlercreutzia equolifaciens]